MISHFEFQLVCVSVPKSALRIRATVVKELNGTVYTVSLAPRVLVASHVMLLSLLIKQTLGSLDLPSLLEPRGLYRTDGKRTDGVTMMPCEMGKQLVWDVTVVDALAPSRLNQGSLCNPGTTATEAEARKIEKYRELIDNGYFFQPVALEVQGSLDESSENFITRLCKMLYRSHDNQRAGSFLKQRISLALQIGNAACVLGTVSDRDAFEEIYYI